MQGKIRELLDHIEQENEKEQAEYGDDDLEELGENARVITSEGLEQKIEELNRKLQDNPKDKVKKAVRIMQKDYLPRTKK